MVEYNPFDKEVSRLRRPDLDKLVRKEVAEGWFVEYKEDFPSNKKIGHSIAAFANSDGGWYIIGVKANQDNVAESITGFDLAINRSPKEKVRDIIKTHVRPIPYFESKLTMLSNNRAVLTVYVEQGNETPYVTADGRIYRRVGEGSDPIPETDRYSIQKLFERSYELKERIEQFSQNPFSMSKLQAKQGQCFLETYFYTRPFETFRFKDFYTRNFFDELRKTFSSPVTLIVEPTTAYISFNNFYTSARSHILRHIPNREASIDLTLTVELFENGDMRMFIPMPKLPLGVNLDSLPTGYRDFGHYGTFLSMLSPNEFTYLNVIDAYQFFVTFTILFNQYCNFLKKCSFRRHLRGRLRFSETWRTLLYFDNEQYLNFLKDYGLPICQKSEIEIPEFYAGKTIPIALKQASAFSLIAFMYEALGFPLSFVSDSLYGLGEYIAGLSKTTAQRSSSDQL